jgi:hypothetical protein
LQCLEQRSVVHGQLLMKIYMYQYIHYYHSRYLLLPSTFDIHMYTLVGSHHIPLVAELAIAQKKAKMPDDHTIRIAAWKKAILP